MLISRRELENTVIVIPEVYDETLEYATAMLADWFRQVLFGDVRRIYSDGFAGIKANRIFLLAEKVEAISKFRLRAKLQAMNSHPEGYAIVSFRKGSKEIIALIGNTSAD